MSAVHSYIQLSGYIFVSMQFMPSKPPTRAITRNVVCLPRNESTINGNYIPAATAG